jgi:hypothetical protein
MRRPIWSTCDVAEKMPASGRISIARVKTLSGVSRSGRSSGEG